MTKRVLNVGGATKNTPLPPHFSKYEHHLLDIRSGPDIDLQHDARCLTELAPDQYEAIYCSHNLEHYHRYEVYRVLAGFQHILRPGGFVQIIVPDVRYVMERMIKQGHDLDQILYQSPVGPIKYRDVIYGYGPEIESTGQDFYAHKTGFSVAILKKVLMQAGFKWLAIGDIPQRYEVLAYAAFNAPEPETLQLLGLD